MRRAVYQHGVDKIRILGNNNTTLLVRKSIDLPIRCAIAVWEIKCMNSIMSKLPQPVSKAPR